MANIAELLALSASLSDQSDSPRLDAELLLCHALGCERIYLLTWPDREPRADQEALYHQLLRRRRQGEPVAYLIGEREFWSLPLKVSSATLIPRPETELLVETALEVVIKEFATVLDLGTGSGAIALALGRERPQWRITAVEKSPAALAVARENATRLHLNRVAMLQSDWFSAVNGAYDLIVSNPPYIAEEDSHLQQGDVRFEPPSALVAGNKGLADIEQIADEASEHLNKGGWLMVEHGAEQGEAVRGIFAAMGYGQVDTRCDLANLERVTMGCW